MKLNLFKILVITSILCMMSCASTKYISIDIMKPATISLPNSIVNIAIVDNAGLVLSDSIIDSTTSDLELITSNGKEILKETLIQQMDEQEYFHQVVAFPMFLRTDKNYGYQLPLRKEEIKTIASEMDADAVISLDMFETKKNAALVNMDGFIFKATKFVDNVVFRVFDSNGNMLAPIMTTKDSLEWLGDRDADIERSYKELAQIMADGITKQLIPHWESQERQYYTDGTKEMKEAHKLVQEGLWREAALSWGEAFEKQTSSNQKAKIAANIALANENLGDLENAVEWIRIASNNINEAGVSEENYEKIYIEWYKIKLLEREQDNPKVMKQLNVEED